MLDHMRGSCRERYFALGKCVVKCGVSSISDGLVSGGLRWGRWSELESPQNGPSEAKEQPAKNYEE
jgi:hypothetical protein